METCLTAQQIEDLASGSIAEPDSGALSAHLDGCATCREQFDECADNLAYFAKAKSVLVKGSGEPVTNTIPVRPVPAELTGRGTILSIDIPGYDIIRELHFGGQGVVFEAVQLSTKRKVAIKVLLEGADASDIAKKRFEREIELVASLKHPNIVSIFDSGVAPDGRQYYIMDFVRGLSLHHHVRDKKLSLNQTLLLFIDVCNAVNHAHQHGIIHRDLKPSNVMVTGEGSPRVLDFGLAKWLAAPVSTLVSQAGQVLGTIPYMSPEQIKGDPDDVDIRSDVYSLGIMLYELLTGTHPYPTTGEFSQVFQHITDTSPTSLSDAWKADAGISKFEEGQRADPGRCPINDELETIVLTSLKKDRERRYQTAGELSRDISRYLNGAPIEAKRDSASYVLRKTMWRYRVPMGVIGGFVIMVLIGLFAVSIQRAQLARQRGALEQSRAGEMIAALVNDPAGAIERIDKANPAAHTMLAQIGSMNLTSDSYTDRIMGARAGLLVDPEGFWKSVDGGSLWNNGEWLELCELGKVAPDRILGQLATKAKGATDRQKYIAFCIIGQLALKDSALADLAAKAVQTELHPGVVSAAKWAAERMGRAVAYRPGQSIITDETAGMTFLRIPGADAFRRGSSASDRYRLKDEEMPDEEVSIGSIYVSTTEVTMGALAPFYQATVDTGVFGERGQYIQRDYELNSTEQISRAAARFLSLDLARRFCSWLNQQAEKSKSKHRYRLLTEDEWEYACRAENSSRYCYGDDPKYADYFAACNGNADAQYAVGRRMPNWFGLFDMHGGLWELCDSPYEREFLDQNLQNDPRLEGKEIMVTKGGAFYSPAVRCRSSQRNHQVADDGQQYTGFRLVLERVDP